MANPGIGTKSYARYGYESVYNTAVADGSLSTYFGHNVKFTASPKNNFERIPNLNSRNYTRFAAKKFEGSFNADFDVSNFYFLKGLIGTPTTTGGGPYTHTYAESTTPSGATIQMSEDLDTDSERTLTGCIFDKATLNFNVGEVVTGRIDGLYASESKESTLNATGNATDSEEVFTFSHATLELPDTTTITLVDSLEMSVSNNAELIWGLGSRKASQRAFKTRAYEFKLNKIREQDTDLLDKFYGSATSLSDPNSPAPATTLQLTLTNGLSSTNLRRFIMTLGDIQVEDYSTTLNASEVVKEGVTLYALKVSGALTYENNSSTHP